MNSKKKKIIGIVILLVIIVAIPLTVWIAQQQQETRQRAAENNVPVDLFFSEGNTCSSKVTELGLNVGDEMTLSICLETNNVPINGFDFKIDVGDAYDYVTDLIPSEGSDAGQFEVLLHAEKRGDNNGEYIHFAKVSTENEVGGNDVTLLHLAKMSFTVTSVGTGTLSIREDKQITSPNVPDESLPVNVQPLSYTISSITGIFCTTNPDSCPDDKVCRSGECSTPICTTLVDTECRHRVFRDHACFPENEPNGTGCTEPANGTCQNGACTAGPTATLTPTQTPTPSPTGSQNPTVTLTVTPTTQPTLPPGTTGLSVSVTLPGIAQPPAACVQNTPDKCIDNPNPRRTTRGFTLDLYASGTNPETDPPTFTIANNLVLDPGKKFSHPALRVPAGFQTGIYDVLITVDGYLRKRVRGNITITNGIVTSLPATSITTMDIVETATNKNRLDILDFNAFKECYNKPFTENCTKSDFNDDGNVNYKDLTIFTSTFSIREGD